jgi:signal transduction histidine kinase/ActR/RegA family two-component response regulator
MSAQDALAAERLARVMTVRHRQFAMRVVVGAVVAGLFFGFTGWMFATVWFVGYTALQLFEDTAYGTDPARILKSRAGYRGTLYLLALNTILFSGFGLKEALSGGAWGVACACLLWAGAIMSSVVVSNGSKDAFVYSALPSALFYLTAPLFTLMVNAPWIDAGAVIVAGGLNLMVGVTVWAASQKLYEAELAAREELERKKLEAEAATAAKSAFVAMVSHELRTPISAILAGASEVEKTFEPGLRSNGVLISDSARMMRTLLNDLLDLSKIEAGRMSVETIPYDLRSLVLDTLKFWSKQMAKKGVRLRLLGAGSLPRWVEGDPTRLRQILNNLFSNAIKFTAQGSITLKLSVTARAGGMLDVGFDVIDTGPGMSEDQLSRLFTAFEQLGAATARTHGGTGLGLAISRDLAQLMGGDLTASSAEGQGATFSLCIPLRKAAPVAVQDAEDAEVAAGGEMYRPLRILIADDHEFNRRAFSLMLQAAAAEITAVEDGQKALEALDIAVFDVVLMDVNMPEMGGLEAVRRLRAAGGPNASTPIIALTAAGGAEDIAACRAVGMDGFVTKPVEGAELFAAIEQVLCPEENDEPAALSA